MKMISLGGTFYISGTYQQKYFSPQKHEQKKNFLHDFVKKCRSKTHYCPEDNHNLDAIKEVSEEKKLIV